MTILEGLNLMPSTILRKKYEEMRELVSRREVYTIGDICKEVQRIQSDLEDYGNIDSAIDRCKKLDQLLCDIEEGKYPLIIKV